MDILSMQMWPLSPYVVQHFTGCISTSIIWQAGNHPSDNDFDGQTTTLHYALQSSTVLGLHSWNRVAFVTLVIVRSITLPTVVLLLTAGHCNRT